MKYPKKVEFMEYTEAGCRISKKSHSEGILYLFLALRWYFEVSFLPFIVEAQAYRLVAKFEPVKQNLLPQNLFFAKVSVDEFIKLGLVIRAKIYSP